MKHNRISNKFEQIRKPMWCFLFVWLLCVIMIILFILFLKPLPKPLKNWKKCLKAQNSIWRIFPNAKIRTTLNPVPEILFKVEIYFRLRRADRKLPITSNTYKSNNGHCFFFHICHNFLPVLHFRLGDSYWRELWKGSNVLSSCMRFHLNQSFPPHTFLAEVRKFLLS